ncbi:MAG: inositol monophosphatase family protein, partial [Bacteroidota bacterium]
MDGYLAILEEAKLWAREVGRIQVEGMKEILTIANKSSEYDLVTNIDTQSEQELIKRIYEEYPEHAILSEESGVLGKDSEYLWIVDPLDGTVNYAHRYPVFCISLA